MKSYAITRTMLELTNGQTIPWAGNEDTPVNSIDAIKADIQDLHPQVYSTIVLPTQKDENGSPIPAPMWNFVFCRFGTQNRSLVVDLPNALVFPECDMDRTLESIEPQTLADLKQNFEAYVMADDGNGNTVHFELDISDLTISWRQLLRQVYCQFEPSLTVQECANSLDNHFDVPEPE